MRDSIRIILLLFTALFFQDIPLEWQGFTGFIIGSIVGLTLVGGKNE